MIIWGWRAREIRRESGEFHCPECRADQDYQLYRVATYFTLYFIPLFETTHHGDYVQCLGCKSQYNPDVLDYEPLSQIEEMVYAIRADMENGTPIEMARTKLLNSGFETDLADQVVTVAAGDTQVHCRSCNLSFVDQIARCSGCGGAL